MTHSTTKESKDFTTPHKNSKIKKSTLFEILRYPKDVHIPSIKNDIKSLPKNDSFVWFGHSSILLMIGGKRVLVDPILGSAASPFGRICKPFNGADIYKPNDLPPIDYLIITHNHYDHLSKNTIKKLDITKAFVPLGVGKYLQKWGIKKANITELGWWESTDLDNHLRLHCFPTRHFSGRFLTDTNKTLWASYGIECLKNQNKKIYLSGDGGYGEHFKDIGEAMGGFDISFIENGQYNEQWAKIHLFPNESLQACADLHTKVAVPIHNSKFKLSTHKWSEPLESISTLYENARKNGKIDFGLLTPMIGEIVPLWEEDRTHEIKAREINKSEKNKSEIDKSQKDNTKPYTNKWWRI